MTIVYIFTGQRYGWGRNAVLRHQPLTLHAALLLALCLMQMWMLRLDGKP